MTPHDLARAFAQLLKAEFSTEQWHVMRQRNRTNAPSACASRDFCDSSVFMSQAFETVFGRECVPEMQPERELIDAAWTIAKRDYLTASQGESI